MRTALTTSSCALLWCGRAVRGESGCTEPKAVNYSPRATSNDGSCVGWEACVKSGGGGGECANCLDDAYWGPCTSTNVGFRHPSLDRLVAAKVARGAVTLDGDLSEWWALTPRSRRYEMPAFATLSGEVRRRRSSTASASCIELAR